MEAALFGLALIFGAVTWRYVWCPTVLDIARDKLFDLRDKEVRNYFLRRGVPLNDKLYRALRDLINGHLRHTESLHVWPFILAYVWAERNPDVAAAIKESIEQNFSTDDPDLRSFAQVVRVKATVIMVGYMVESSLVALLINRFAALLVNERDTQAAMEEFAIGPGT